MAASTETSEPHIGTLNEGSLHAALKQVYAEPGDTFEVPLDRFVIDISRDELLIEIQTGSFAAMGKNCLLYTSPSPRDRTRSRMPSSA